MVYAIMHINHAMHARHVRRDWSGGSFSCKRLMAGLEPREMCVFETSWAVFQLRAERGRMGRMRSKVDELRGNMRSVCESEGFGFSAKLIHIYR